MTADSPDPDDYDLYDGDAPDVDGLEGRLVDAAATLRELRRSL